MLGELWEAVAPHTLDAFGAILTVFFGWISLQLREKWHIEIEEKHSQRLHSALMSGAQMAMERKLTGQAAVSLAVEYAKSSVPDAIRYLTAPDGVLFNLAMAKLHQIK